jgi:hypothetical protein
MPCSIDFPRWRVCTTALLALAGAAASAAPPTAAAARPDPLEARSAVPPLQHRSAFTGYRRADDVPVGAWRELNDATARAGGWRAYAREASSSPPAPAAPSASASGRGHGAHH